MFWGLDAGKPRSDGKFLLDGLHRKLDAMGIDWKARNIVFHSHRHFFSARMADIAAADKVQRITGHRNAAVFEAYADHVTDAHLSEMPELERTAFAGLVA